MADSFEKFEGEHKVVTAFIETAKTYIQLSVGGLVLTITFYEKILGGQGAMKVNATLLIAWLFWLLTMVMGSFYQYLVVKFLEDRGERLGILNIIDHPRAFENIQPRWIYGIMLITFYIGCISFSIFGIMNLYFEK